MAFELSVPPRVRPQGGSWARFLAVPRLAASRTFEIDVAREFRIGDNRDWQALPPAEFGFHEKWTAPANWSTPLNPAALNGLRPGPQVTRIRVTIQIYDGKHDRVRGDALHRGEREFVVPWELLPAGGTSVANAKND